MPTYTLSDGTTTITFSAFTEIDRRIEAMDFIPTALPDYEGVEVTHLGALVRVFTLVWHLQDDPTYPSSGDSATTKRKALETLLLNGGVNEGLFTLTFDSEDSQVASPILENYNVKLKLYHVRSAGGEMVSEIEGELELWETKV